MSQNTTEKLRALADYIETNVAEDGIYMRGYFNLSFDYTGPFPSYDGPKAALVYAKHSGTAFCAIGWAAVLFPDLATEHEDFCIFANKLFPRITGGDWLDAFSTDLSDNKDECIQRLRDKADEIDARGES